MTLKLRDVECQFRQTSGRRRPLTGSRGQARCTVSSRNQMRRRELSPHSVSKTSATIWPSRPEDLSTAWRCSSHWPLSDVRLGLPTFPPTSQSRYIEAVVGCPRGGPRRLDLSAERQPGGGGEIRLQAALDGGAADHAATLLDLRGDAGSGGRLQCHPHRGDVYDPAAWGADALFRPKRARPSAGCIIWDIAMRSGSAPTSRALYVLGLSGRRVAAEQGHPHRPSAAVARGGRPARRRGHRQACARRREAVGPCAGLGGAQLEYRTEKHGPAKAGLRSGFRINPMPKQKDRDFNGS